MQAVDDCRWPELLLDFAQRAANGKVMRGQAVAVFTCTAGDGYLIDL